MIVLLCLHLNLRGSDPFSLFCLWRMKNFCLKSWNLTWHSTAWAGVQSNLSRHDLSCYIWICCTRLLQKAACRTLFSNRVHQVLHKLFSFLDCKHLIALWTRFCSNCNFFSLKRYFYKLQHFLTAESLFSPPNSKTNYSCTSLKMHLGTQCAAIQTLSVDPV